MIIMAVITHIVILTYTVFLVTFMSFSDLVHHDPVWFLVGNGGMDYGDNYWGLYRGYYRDPFPHSLLSTKQSCYLHVFL